MLSAAPLIPAHNLVSMQELDFFSYEHFYVIYTSFWKLDRDHDLTISQAELTKYGDGGTLQ